MNCGGRALSSRDINERLLSSTSVIEKSLSHGSVGKGKEWLGNAEGAGDLVNI